MRSTRIGYLPSSAEERDGRMGGLVQGKIEALYRTIHDLHAAASDAAKRTIPRDYVEDLFLHLYLLLGDLVVLAGVELKAKPAVEVSSEASASGPPQ